MALSCYDRADSEPRGIEIWKNDNSLTAALEQSLEFLVAVDFMSVLIMWPSESRDYLSPAAVLINHNPVRRQYHIKLRKELMECCDIAGISYPHSWIC